MKICPSLALTALFVSIGYCAGSAVSPPALPRTYYISFTHGSDSRNGQSPADAWQHLWKIYAKAASKDPFQPGDSILLARGDQWSDQIRLRASGSAQQPITVGAYGRGPKPLLYGDDQQVRWEPVDGHRGIYTTEMGEGSIVGPIFLDGKALKPISPAGSINRDADLETFLARLQPGASLGQFGSRLWVRMMDDRPPHTVVRVFRGAGVFLGNSSYVRIEDLDIQRFYTGIDVSNSHQVLIHHNDIQDVLGIGIYLRLGDANCQVESNTVFRSGNTALYVLKGSNNTFRDNWVSHVDVSVLGIHLSGDKMGIGLQESQQSLVEYNYFSHSGGMDFYYEQGSTVRYNYLYHVRSAGAPHGVDLKVYGNIYNLGKPAGKNSAGIHGSTGVNAGTTGPGTIAVFNNTIFNASSFFLMGSTAHGGKVLFSDNIAFSSAPGPVMTIFKANVVSNHNCFSTPGQPIFRYNDISFPSLPAYQAGSGLDRDSVFANPGFVSATPLTPLDFRPSPNSGCNSPALNSPLADPANGRTYDHDGAAGGAAVVMGSLRVEKSGDETLALIQSRKSHYFRHPFTVTKGVYLVRITFAARVLSGPRYEFSFLVNDRKVAARFEPAEFDGGDAVVQYFLVRTDGNSITLAPGQNTDISLVTGVDVIPFDTSHGDGPQVISW
jgi:parallel beta-helix repeat protein